MSASDWGRTFETHSADRWHLEDVAANGGDDALIDGYTTRRIAPRTTGAALRGQFYYAAPIPPGAAVACKVCQRRIADGDTTRYGRWYITGEELDVVDAVALGIYHEDGGIIGDAVTILPTTRVAALCGAFSDAAHPDYETVTRPAWSRVFDPEVVYGA